MFGVSVGEEGSEIRVVNSYDPDGFGCRFRSGREEGERSVGRIWLGVSRWEHNSVGILSQSLLSLHFFAFSSLCL